MTNTLLKKDLAATLTRRPADGYTRSASEVYAHRCQHCGSVHTEAEVWRRGDATRRIVRCKMCNEVEVRE